MGNSKDYTSKFVSKSTRDKLSKLERLKKGAYKLEGAGYDAHNIKEQIRRVINSINDDFKDETRK